MGCRQSEWGDMGILRAHGNDIVRIAVEGEERWKDEVFAFLGKGFRITEIEFFPPASTKEAEDWMRR